MVFVKRSELNAMKKKVIDRFTGMTELDAFEARHCYEDWKIIEDVKEDR